MTFATLRSRWWTFAFVLLLCLTFFAAFQYRRTHELNYGQLHARLPAEWASQVAGVFVRLPDSSLRSLQSREEDRSVYSMLNTVPPATSIVVCGKKGFQPGDVRPEIRCGENWVAPCQSLAIPSSAGKLRTNQEQSPQELVWFEFVPEPYSSQRRLATNGVVNWQGDYWMIGVPLLQSLILGLLLLGGYRLLTSAGERGLIASGNYSALNLKQTPFFALCSGIVRCMLLILTLQQLFEFWPWLRDVRWGNQFLAACLGFAVLLGLIGAYLRAILGCGSEKRRLLLAGAFLLVSLVLKLIWVRNIDSVQTGDYEKYWRYGKAIALNDWDQIGDTHWPTRVLYLQRARTFITPIVQLFGAGISAVEVSCVVLQLLTVVICGWLIRRMFTLQTACCSLPFLIFYPAFWYAPTLAAINNIGFLSMVAVWCLVQLSMTFLRSLYGRMLTPGDYLRWAGLILLLAVMLAFVDLQKSFGVFVVLTTVIAGFYAVVRYLKMPDEQRPANFFRTMFMAVAMLYFSWHFSRMMQKSVSAEIMARTGPLPHVSMMDYFSAVDSTTNGDGRTLDNWRFAYVPTVPAALRSRVLFRKLLHEKVAVGMDLWLCALRKNAFMTLQTDYKNRTFGGYAQGVEGRWEFTRVPWNSAQNLVLQGFYSILLLLALKRLLAATQLPVAVSELFPLLFVIGQYFVILFAMEAGPYYSHILGFPLAWTAGLVVSQKSTEPRALRTLGLEVRSLLPGAIALAIIIAWQLVAGMAVDRSELSFLKLQSGDAAESSEMAVVEQSRVHRALTFPADRKVLQAGDTVSTSVVIPAAFARSPYLCFFLSVNARARNLYRKNAFWDELPVEYELVAGEKVIRSGRLGDLHPPSLILLTISDFSTTIQDGAPVGSGTLPELKLTLRVTEELQIPARGVMPSIAVEYAFNPQESAFAKPSATTEMQPGAG